MRRILLIAALLLPLSSAMATVTITATPGAQTEPDGVPHVPVTIGYISDVNVRAFALDLSVDNGTNIGDDAPTGFLAGESIAPSKGYGIFPSRFRDFIDPANPNWGDGNYMPITAWNEPGAENTGLGWPSMVVEMGTLYSGDGNRPDLTGTLFTFDVNSELADDCNLTIDEDDLRGGLVDEDAAGITAHNLPLVIHIDFVPPGCTMPNVVAMDRASARSAIDAAGFTVYNDDVNVPGTGQAVGTVIGQDPAVGGPIDCLTPVTLTVVAEPFRQSHPDYANWSTVGKPDCWAYERQCNGDADGKKQILYWVSQNDLNILRSGIGKISPPGTSICADFDHKKQILYWVSQNDLNILRSYIGKTVVPSCNASLMNYWCVPGGTCPP